MKAILLNSTSNNWILSLTGIILIGFLLPLTSFSNRQDISPQSILVPPPDIVISCKYWLNPSDLDNPNSSTFGRIAQTRNERKKVSTYDIVCPGFCEADGITGYRPSLVQDGRACDYFNQKYVRTNKNQKYTLVWGWDGYTKFPEPVNIEVLDLRACGSGNIVRNFQVKSSGRWVTVASQTIWIVNCNPFFINTDICRDNTDNIEWPLNCNQPNILDGCNADTKPSNPRLSKPKLVGAGRDNCAMIAIDYKDEVITVEPNACYKVLRTWRVVDWCQYHPSKNPYRGKWEYLQVIKVRDKIDPVIQWDSIARNPLDTIFPDSICGGHYSLSITASDDCTPDSDLRYEYKIDLFDDGVGVYGNYDLFMGKLNRKGVIPSQFDNIYADDTSTVLNASGYYPLGTHRITWFVEDGCSNVVAKDTTFTITDRKRPTPYCETGIISVVMPSTGAITIWAKDLDLGSFDNCTDSKDLKLYFNGDPNWTGYIVTCDTFQQHGVNDKVVLDVQLWVEDEAGNTDYCITTIEIQDNQSTCPNNLTGLTGSFTNPLGKIALDSIQIEVVMNDQVVSTVFPNKYGQYHIDTAGISQDAHLRMRYMGDIIVNFTTKDLIKLQKHILGKQPFNSTLQYLAADLDGDRRIRINDLLLMYKRILGIDDTHSLQDADALKFFVDKCPITGDSSYQSFPDIDDVVCANFEWMYKQYIPGESVYFQHYYMGDLKQRSGKTEYPIYLKVSDMQKDNSGYYVDLSMEINPIVVWAGFDISINAFLPGKFEMLTKYILFDQNLNNGKVHLLGLRSLYGNPELVGNVVKLRYRFNNAASSVDAFHQFQLVNAHDSNVLLDVDGYDYRVVLKNNASTIKNAATSNATIWPNPVRNNLNISYLSAEVRDIQIYIFDVSGQLVKTSNYTLVKGANDLKININTIGSSGLYLVSIRSNEGVQVKRFIKE